MLLLLLLMLLLPPLLLRVKSAHESGLPWVAKRTPIPRRLFVCGVTDVAFHGFRCCELSHSLECAQLPLCLSTHCAVLLLDRQSPRAYVHLSVRAFVRAMRACMYASQTEYDRVRAQYCLLCSFEFFCFSRSGSTTGVPQHAPSESPFSGDSGGGDGSAAAAAAAAAATPGASTARGGSSSAVTDAAVTATAAGATTAAAAARKSEPQNGVHSSRRLDDQAARPRPAAPAPQQQHQQTKKDHNSPVEQSGPPTPPRLPLAGD